MCARLIDMVELPASAWMPANQWMNWELRINVSELDTEFNFSYMLDNLFFCTSIFLCQWFDDGVPPIHDWPNQIWIFHIFELLFAFLLFKLQMASWFLSHYDLYIRIHPQGMILMQFFEVVQLFDFVLFRVTNNFSIVLKITKKVSLNRIKSWFLCVWLNAVVLGVWHYWMFRWWCFVDCTLVECFGKFNKCFDEPSEYRYTGKGSNRCFCELMWGFLLPRRILWMGLDYLNAEGIVLVRPAHRARRWKCHSLYMLANIGDIVKPIRNSSFWWRSWIFPERNSWSNIY